MLHTVVNISTSYGQEQCEELINEVTILEERATNAYNRMNFQQSTPAFYQAADLYEKINVFPGCSKIPLPFNPLVKADKYREMAAESRAFELFKNAKIQYTAGENFGRNQQWKEATKAFEDAAITWEYAAELTTHNENQKKALQSAKQARDLAKRAAIFHE